MKKVCIAFLTGVLSALLLLLVLFMAASIQLEQPEENRAIAETIAHVVRSGRFVLPERSIEIAVEGGVGAEVVAKLLSENELGHSFEGSRECSATEYCEELRLYGSKQQGSKCDSSRMVNASVDPLLLNNVVVVYLGGLVKGKYLVVEVFGSWYVVGRRISTYLI